MEIPDGPATAGRAGIDAEIWQTYVSEANEYDKRLIASWNEDLDALLIFVCCTPSSLPMNLIAEIHTNHRLVFFLPSSAHLSSRAGRTCERTTARQLSIYSDHSPINR